MPSNATPGPSTPTFNSTLLQLSLLVTAFTLPLTAFRVVGGLDSIDAFFLTTILGFMACTYKFATRMVDSYRDEVKRKSDATVEKKEASGQEEYVKTLEQKLESWGRMWEDKVTNGADLASTSATCSKVTPATSKRLLFWWSPVPHTLYITVFIALPSMVAQCVAGWTTEQNMLFTAMLMGVSCFLEIFWMFVLEPLDEETETKSKVTAEVREKTTAATGSGEHIKTLEEKIDELNKRLEHQEMAASRPAPASTTPRNVTRVRPHTGLLSTFSRLSTIDFLMIICTSSMVTGNLYCYTEGLIRFTSMVYLIALSLVSLVIEIVMSTPRRTRQESKPETKSTADVKKRETEQEGIAQSIKALEDKIADMGNSMKSEMEGMEKRLVEHSGEMEQRLYCCTEVEVDHLKAGLEETLTKQMSVKSDMLRRWIGKKISRVVNGMEGKMQRWSQEKLSELSEKVSQSLDARLWEQGGHRTGVSLGMPEELVGLVERLELALETEWQGIGTAKAMKRLETAMEKVMRLAWTDQPSGLASDNCTDFEEGWEAAVSKVACGEVLQEMTDEASVCSQEGSQEADIDIEEESDDDDWKLIDHI